MSQPDIQHGLQSSPPREEISPSSSRENPVAFDLPAYPGGNVSIPNIGRTSLIVEILAGAILGTMGGGLFGWLMNQWHGLFVGVGIGLVVGILAGMIVGKITGPTGVLTGRSLAGAMVRVTLVTLFGVFISVMGGWWMLLDRHDTDNDRF